ncbi:hypothetical protein [Deinococcus radiodurans]|uniref:hypothetical protein n=1 Tax=Deinococcus radiodurans TaxID=1299 RepID=UPI00312C8E07
MTTASSALPFAVVLNAQAGRGLAGREWPRLRGELEARGIAYQLVAAQSGAGALAEVQALPPGQPVLAAGATARWGRCSPRSSAPGALWPSCRWGAATTSPGCWA